ncbi:MAG: hypothetical protein JXP34_10190 [Planctomycetes bacterium]|nr:hypothetical protein [Planctomycetota bacterium]
MSVVGLAALLILSEGRVPSTAAERGVEIAIYQVIASRKGQGEIPKELAPFQRELRHSPYRRFALVGGFPRRLKIAYEAEEAIGLLGDGAVRITPHLKDGKPYLKVALQRAGGGPVIGGFDRPNSPLLVATPFRTGEDQEILVIIDRLSPDTRKEP